MKKNKSFDTGKAQYMVASAMEEMTRATEKVLVEYLFDGYIKNLAKAIAYLEVDDAKADDILCNFSPDVRKKIIDCAKDFKKTDKDVIEEVEHIIATEGMTFNHDYQIIKENLLLTGQDFAEEINLSGTSEPLSLAYSPIINFDSKSQSNTGFSLILSKIKDGRTSKASTAPFASS